MISRFYTGIACRSCGGVKRYRATSKCVACTKKHSAKAYELRAAREGRERGKRGPKPRPIYERKLDPRQCFTVRLDPDLYLKIVERAKDEERSLNSQLQRDLRQIYG